MLAAEMPAGAAPERAPDWHSIEWKNVWRTVRRVQARIVKAVAEGRWNKVKALVYLLTHSFSARALAILRRREKGTSLNSDSLAPKPLASSVYVLDPEAHCPHKRSVSVMSLFPSPGLLRTLLHKPQVTIYILIYTCQSR